MRQIIQGSILKAVVISSTVVQISNKSIVSLSLEALQHLLTDPARSFLLWQNALPLSTPPPGAFVQAIPPEKYFSRSAGSLWSDGHRQLNSKCQAASARHQSDASTSWKHASGRNPLYLYWHRHYYLMRDMQPKKQLWWHASSDNVSDAAEGCNTNKQKGEAEVQKQRRICEQKWS